MANQCSGRSCERGMTMSIYIAHSRTEGSKNGVRRWQYEDGTWTPEGLERRREEYRKINRKNGSGLRALIGGTGAGLAAVGAIAGVAGSKNPQQVTNAISTSKNTLDSSKQAADLFKKGKLRPSDVKTQDLSNDDLNNIVKRMELEKKYADLLDNDREKGGDWVTKVMGTVGGLLAAGASIAVIYSVIKAKKNS